MLNALNSNNIITLEGVSKEFLNHERGLVATNLRIKRGEFVCIVGPSGCGKSTLLKLIAGLEEPTTGTIVRPANVGMVFQSGALLPWLSAAENVAVSLTSKGLAHSLALRQVEVYLKLMSLQTYSNKYPRELSGGQRQRVGIARALAAEPEVLLLDEPFSALDIKTTEELHADIIRIWQASGQTMVMVSHSIEEAALLADRVIFMREGSIVHEIGISLARPRREINHEFSYLTHRLRQKFFAK